MTTINNFEDVRALEHIKESGLLDEFTTCFGSVGSATLSAAGKIDLTKVAEGKRAVLVRVTSGDAFGKPYLGFTQKLVSTYVFSKVGDDEAITKGLATDIWKYLIENYQNSDQCISSISTSGVTGPQYTEDSRAVYEIPLTIRFNL